MTQAPNPKEVRASFIEGASKIYHLKRRKNPRESVRVAGLMPYWDDPIRKAVLALDVEQFPLYPPRFY